MKKIYLFVIACGLSCAGALAQQFPATFQWGKLEGKWAYDYGYGINTDNSGNVYVAGKYEESGAYFGNTTVNCNGNHDGFLAKYAPDGTLQWVHTVGGVGGDYYEALSTDKSNYIYVSGEIENNTLSSSVPVYFSNSNTVTLNTKKDNDAFLAKFDLSGNLVWALSEGGDNSEKGLGNAVDPQGNVYMCGYFTDATTFNGQTFASAGGRDIYVAKYNKDGQFQWFKHAGSAGRDEAKAAVCDAQGNVYICGMFDKDCNFMGTNITTRKGTAYWDAFVAKLNTNGDLQWVRTGGGDVDDGAWAITIDNGGNIYIGGETAAYAEFGPHIIQAYGAADSYIAKYNSNGDCLWAKHGGSTKVDRIRGIGTDGEFVFATGQFGGTAIFGNGTNSVTAVDTSDVFITAIDANGSWGFVASIGGVPDSLENLGYESGNAVTGTPSGDVYATGGMLTGAQFGSGNPISGYTKTDAFVTKLTWPRQVGVSELATMKKVNMHPNPATNQLTVDLRGIEGKVNVCLYNCLGEKLRTVNASGNQATLDLAGYSTGVYFIQLEGEESKSPAEKLIVQH